uniref:Uncharacterized protein n=1 Tax=Strigamia maritima TaxID=126957 RepID=T1JK91_STRMM
MKGKPGFIPAHTAAVARRRRNNNESMQNKTKQNNGNKAMLQSAVNHALEDVPFILFSSASLAKYEEQKKKVISEYGFLPKRSPTIKDGSVLPRRFEPVSPYFYGKPIEEIENGIYEKF